MPEAPKETSITPGWLKGQLRTSQGNLRVLHGVAEKSIRAIGGRTDGGRSFSTTWGELWRDVEETIDDLKEPIATQEELDRICGQVRETVNAFVGEFNIQRSGGASKRLIRGVRAEHRRVQDLIAARFKLAVITVSSEVPAATQKAREETEDDAEEAPRGMMPAPSDREWSELYFQTQLENLVFSVLEVFFARLQKERLWKKEEEALDEKSFIILKHFIEELKKLLDEIIKFMNEKFRAGVLIEFEEFQRIFLEKINAKKPSRDKRYHGEDHKGNKYTRIIEEYFGRLLEKIREMESAEEFYTFNPGAETRILKSTDFTAEKLFLPQKSAYIQQRDSEGESAEDDHARLPPFLYEIERADIRAHWYRARADENDYLNGAARKGIAREKNGLFHGGLPLRTAGDIRLIIQDIHREDKEDAARKAAEAPQILAWHMRLLEWAREDFTARLSKKIIELVRKRLEESRGVEAGGMVTFDAQFFQKLAQVLENITQCIQRCFETYRDNFAEKTARMTELFAPKSLHPIITSDHRLIMQMIQEAAPQLGLALADIHELRTITIDRQFVFERIGNHAKEEPTSIVVESFDRNAASRTALLGPLAAHIETGGYPGAMAPHEQHLLKLCCDLYPITPADTVDTIMANAASQGMFRQWATQLNDSFYGGMPVRNEETVKGCVREILVTSFLERRRAMHGAKQEITPELQGRIDEVRAWVTSLPGDPERFYRKMLAALAARLASEVVNHMPPVITRDIVEKLELCKARARIVQRGGKDYVAHRLSDAEISSLFDAVRPEHGKFEPVEKIIMRLEDIEKSITHLRSQIEEKRQKAIHLGALQTEQRGHSAALQAQTEVLRTANEAIAQYRGEIGRIYSDAAAALAEPNQEQIAALQAEIDRKKGEKEEIERAQKATNDALAALAPVVAQLAIEAQIDPKLLEQLGSLEQLKESILRNLTALYEKSYSASSS